MAERWYPVIDYAGCIKCGKCINQCTHGVFDSSKAPLPVVIRPENCVNHCHGCGNLCPTGAIVYAGDDTGWTPPCNVEKDTLIIKEESAGCSCGCGSSGCSSSECDSSECDSSGKTVQIDYLFLDLQVCERCIGTDQILEEVIEELTPALNLAGYSIEYHKVEISTEQLAVKHRFLSSPTVRVNGVDICSEVSESSCGCCSQISGTDVDCRVFEYEGKLYELPPKQMLAEAILRNMFATGPETDCCCYELPENLRVFFEGKAKKEAGCSPEKCCC